MRTGILCLLIILTAVPRAFSWNGEGHMVVAQLAYNHLNASVKTQCDTLIAVPLTFSSTATNTFVTAACWADDFKSSLGTSIWHYIDLPFSLDGTSTSGVAAASFDVVRAIRQCVTTLQSTTETQANKATSLRYLIHFVGDIQQPLHASTAVRAGDLNGDSGGNGFVITGTWSNLHSLWDSGGGFLTDSITRPLSAAEQSSINSRVATVEAAYPYVAGPATIPDPMDWANEGFQLAQTVSYVGITRNGSPSAGYLNTTQSTTQERMAKGGKRLADLLNTIFAATPTTLSAFELE